MVAAAVATALIVCSAPVMAISPLTPHLSESSHSELMLKLDAVGFPEVGKSSVFVALMTALGATPSVADYRYDEPYPQLPKIDVQARPTTDGCSQVSMRAVYDTEVARMRVRIEGLYCVGERMTWSATRQSVLRE